MPSGTTPNAASGPALEPPYTLWPAVLSTGLTGAGFAIFKMLLISEIAMGFNLYGPAPSGLGWVDDLVRRTMAEGTLREAISQGLAATLTVGIIVAFVVNAPLAGATRTGRLFVASSFGMGLIAVLTAPELGANPWPAALLMGAFYGIACAARGKSVPLLAQGTGRSNTVVSGAINAALVVGLLAGSIGGNLLARVFVGDPRVLDRASSAVLYAPWIAHGVLVLFMLATVVSSWGVRVQEPPPTPFGQGFRELGSGTVRLVREHWALLVSGGIAWGIAAAAGVGCLLYAINDLGIGQGWAALLALPPALGAILGNLISHRVATRRHVMVAYLLLAVLIAGFPVVELLPGLLARYIGAATLLTVFGVLFAAPTNVIDARFLLLAGKEGVAGRGGTVFSLVHNLFILAVGAGLSAALFLGWVSTTTQFSFLAGFAVLAMLIAGRAPLHDPEAPSR